jgi:hypothetical protein
MILILPLGSPKSIPLTPKGERPLINALQHKLTVYMHRQGIASGQKC